MVSVQNEVLVLHGYPAHTAPHSSYNQWFGKRPPLFSRERWVLWEFDRRCIAALVVEGIGRKKCPARRPWAYLTIVGALVMELTGKRVQIPEAGFEPQNIEKIAWEALWASVGEYGEKLDRDFLGAILRNFLVGSSESRFAGQWHNLDTGFADTSSLLLCNLRQERIQEGRKAMRCLPEPVQASVRAVAQHVPRMLETTIPHIQKVYPVRNWHW